MIIIKFKSKDSFFHKEQKGWKRNTIRKINDMEDPRFSQLWKMVEDGPGKSDWIEIINADNENYKFRRKIQDVSYWEGIFIISW